MPLNDAIKRAYAGRCTQEELAHALDVTQPKVSRWVTGKLTPSLEEIRSIEEYCDRPIGFILTLAGFVEPARSLPEAIAVEAGLSDDQRRVLAVTYQAFVDDGQGPDKDRA